MGRTRGRRRITGDDADGPRHLDVHGPHVRDLQHEDACVRDGSGSVSRHRGEARGCQGQTAELTSSGRRFFVSVICHCPFICVCISL